MTDSTIAQPVGFIHHDVVHTYIRGVWCSVTATHRADRYSHSIWTDIEIVTDEGEFLYDGDLYAPDRHLTGPEVREAVRVLSAGRMPAYLAFDDQIA